MESRTNYWEWTFSGESPNHRYLVPAIVHALKRLPEGRILDIGCGNGAVAGIPYSVILLVAVVALGTLLLHRTSFGRSLYATGGSPAASRLAGLNIDLFRLISYVISGGCAALAGVLYASQTGVSESNLGGNTVALTALAIVVLGGTSLFGGEGAMWRTVAGFIILASVTTLFSVLAVTQPFQDLIEGLIVVVALVLDASARRRGAI